MIHSPIQFHFLGQTLRSSAHWISHMFHIPDCNACFAFGTLCHCNFPSAHSPLHHFVHPMMQFSPKLFWVGRSVGPDRKFCAALRAAGSVGRSVPTVDFSPRCARPGRSVDRSDPNFRRAARGGGSVGRSRDRVGIRQKPTDGSVGRGRSTNNLLRTATGRWTCPPGRPTSYIHPFAT